MINQPFWSIMIPTYNCNRYLQKTLESVLEQDMGEARMQIEVIDDCSSDSPEELIKEIGKGRVKFFRQEKNVGHVKNFQTALDRAEGEVIHLLHGDDFVLPGFYKKMEEMYGLFPQLGACFTRHFYVDEDDQIMRVSPLIMKDNAIFEDFLFRQLCRQQVQTPSITVKRNVYKELGGFNPSLSWTEDWEMWARIGIHYPIGFAKEPLACYRIHQESSSGAKALTAENVKDLVRLKSILLSYCQKNDHSVVSKSLDKVIFTVALNNYKANGMNKKAAENLYFMAKYSESKRNGLRFYIKYLVSRFL